MKLLTALFLFLFTCAHAQVRTDYYGDTLKGSIKKMTEYRYLGMDTIKSIYTCDQQDRSSSAIFFYGGHQLRCKWLARYNANGSIAETSLYGSPGTLCQRITYKYDTQGRIVERRTFDYRCRACEWLSDILSGTLSNWATGEFKSTTIEKYEYDGKGKVARTIAQVTPGISDGSETLETKTFSYNSDGQVKRLKMETIEIKSGAADTTRSVIMYKYDSKGHKIEEEELKNGPGNYLVNWYENGREITGRSFCTYDERDNLVESRTYFQASWHSDAGKHPAGKRVGAGTEYTYDNFNRMIASRFYVLYRQDDGSEIKDVIQDKKEGQTPQDRKEYDSKGNIIRITRGLEVVLRREVAYF